MCDRLTIMDSDEDGTDAYDIPGNGGHGFCITGSNQVSHILGKSHYSSNDDDDDTGSLDADPSGGACNNLGVLRKQAVFSCLNDKHMMVQIQRGVILGRGGVLLLVVT